MENRYFHRFRVLLSKERTRYMLFLIFSMFTLFFLILAQAIALMVNGNYEYAGILLEIYTVILIVRIITYNGLKRKKFKARSIKKRYLICAVLLLLMAISLPAFYISLFEKKTNPPLPVWMIVIEFVYTAIMTHISFQKYRKERVKFNEYYILYYIIGIVSRLITLVIAINAIINMYNQNSYWLLIQQFAVITSLTFVLVIYIFIRRSKVKDIEPNPEDNLNLTHEKISVFLFEYKEIQKLVLESIPEDERMNFNILKTISNQRYVHFNSYYYNKEFIGICYFTKKNNNIFILYLLIRKEFIHQGYGSMIVKHLNPEVNNIYFNAEPLVEDAINIEERRRKVSFFTKNGLKDSGYTAQFGDTTYCVYSSKDFNEVDYKKMVKLLFRGFNPSVSKK